MLYLCCGPVPGTRRTFIDSKLQAQESPNQLDIPLLPLSVDIFSPPVETSELSDSAHRHNLYIVAGTLGALVLVVVAVLIACYFRIYETYQQLRWHRLRNHIERSTCTVGPLIRGLSVARQHHEAPWQQKQVLRELYVREHRKWSRHVGVAVSG
ncbi:hypothetical protein DPMN_136114 [Dreissena polymorpha]|uniref:Uncharacterized protein n=1 Tax=Dreissena polymorpha TaxID=45954 RepID=A0A9D4G0A8_DREPO|nr:hypothetical protein DPMN_136114 [Dreissena polymorpha]